MIEQLVLNDLLWRNSPFLHAVKVLKIS